MRIPTRKFQYFDQAGFNTKNSQNYEQAGHLEPPEEEGKLDGEEERVEQVQLCLGIAHREAVRLLRKRVC